MQLEGKLYKIAIIGLGLIGGSLAKAIKKKSPNTFIAAFDKNDVIDLAIKEKTIDFALNDYKDAKDYDIIFLCLPIDLSLYYFENLIPIISSNTILTDVCGVKYPFHILWEVKAKAGYYIGGHPMTGKEKGGYSNSDPLLFENSVYILCKSKNSNNEIINKISELLKLTGARLRFLDAKLHDRVVAFVSHLPQLLAVSLVNNLPTDDHNINFLDFAAGGFRDMTRIASSSFDIWESIFKYNKDEIHYALQSLQNILNETDNELLNSELYNIGKKFLSAAIKRDSIPKNNKGFISPIYDILVYVKDEPGVISKISTALFDKNINIKDIELLKIREGDGGTFRLAFESLEDAELAKEILTNIGYKVN
jgi:prephenate dehydrogenase